MPRSRGPGYVYITNWNEFQHYSKREPPWIKNYRKLLKKEEYLALSLAERGLLHGLWLLASEFGDGRVSASRTFLGRRLNVRRVSLEPLIHAGFVTVRASKALADSEQNPSPENRETETETEKASPLIPHPPNNNTASDISAAELFNRASKGAA